MTKNLTVSKLIITAQPNGKDMVNLYAVTRSTLSADTTIPVKYALFSGAAKVLTTSLSSLFGCNFTGFARALTRAVNYLVAIRSKNRTAAFTGSWLKMDYRSKITTCTT